MFPNLQVFIGPIEVHRLGQFRQVLLGGFQVVPVVLCHQAVDFITDARIHTIVDVMQECFKVFAEQAAQALMGYNLMQERGLNVAYRLVVAQVDEHLASAYIVPAFRALLLLAHSSTLFLWHVVDKGNLHAQPVAQLLDARTPVLLGVIVPPSGVASHLLKVGTRAQHVNRHAILGHIKHMALQEIPGCIKGTEMGIVFTRHTLDAPLAAVWINNLAHLASLIVTHLARLSLLYLHHAQGTAVLQDTTHHDAVAAGHLLVALAAVLVGQLVIIPEPDVIVLGIESLA